MAVEPMARLKAENSELKKELHFTRELLESANSIVIRWDKDGIIHFMNDFGLRFFGYSSAEIVGQHLMKIVPKVEKSTGRDMSKLAKDIARNPDQFKSVPSENITKDNRTVWVTWTNKGICDEQGNVQEILAIGNDITAMKQAERSLWEYQEKLDAALESMDDAVFISDSQGNLVNMNEAFATFHRYKNKTECTDQITEYPKVLDVFLPDGTPAPLEQWAIPRALRGESATDFEYTVQRKDTGETWVGNYNFGPFFDSQGNIAGAVVVCRDITERKKLEENLRASEERFKKMFCNNSAVMLLIDPDSGSIIDANRAAESFYKYSYEDLIALNIDKINTLPPEIISQKRQKAFAEKQSYFVFPHKLSNGDIRIVEVHSTLIYTSKKPLLFSIIHDITERKKAEQKLRDANNLNQLIMNSSSIGVLVFKESGPCILANSAAEKIVGTTPEKMFMLNFRQMESYQKTGILADMEESLRTGNTIKREIHTTNTFGKEVWFDGEISTFQQDGANHILFMFSDIIERKQAEKKQAISQKRLEALWKIASLKNADIKTICDSVLVEIASMTNSPYGFYGFLDDPETAMTIHSWSTDTMADCTIHDKPLVFPIEKSGIWGNAVRDRKPFLLNDYREQCSNKKGLPEGHVALTRVLAVPVFQGEKIVALAAVANKADDYNQQDIQQLEVFLANVQILIDQKKAQEERIALEQQLHQAQKMETVGRMAGGIAHNFNNYLAIILGNLQLVKHTELQQKDFTELLNSTHTAAQRASDLVRQIMAFSRQDKSETGCVDLLLLVKETLSMLRSMIPSSVSLNAQLPEEPEEILVEAEASRIQEVLINLSTNALHAMDGKGLLSFSLDTVDLQQSDISSEYPASAGRFARITLEDHGCGMSEETLAKIFEPFFTTKDVGQGTGMGLATVQATLKQYKGFVTVQSELEKGSKFSLYLPTDPTPRRPLLDDEVPETEFPGGSERILFVDDETALAEMTEKMLTALGYRVTAETDSEQALLIFSQDPEQFDLLITDLTMPGMTGLELAKEMHKIRPDLPVILCTGNSSSLTQEQIASYEINSISLKPFKMAELSQAVQAALSS